MSSDHAARPLDRIWHLAREYLTHWAIAGVIVALIGFAPDHWAAHLFHIFNLENLLDSLPSADYRLLAVGLGVAVITGDMLLCS